MEWRRTQQFHWSFARETPAPGDSWIASISLFFAFAFMILFCAIPLIRRVPSPGACILGYQIIRDDGQAMTLRNALLRTFLGFIAAAACYLAPFLFRDRKAGKF